MRVLIFFVLFGCGAVGAAAETAEYFGDWILEDLKQWSNGQAPSYLIRNHLTADDSHSPTLQIICTGTNYRLNFFPGSSVAGGLYNVIIIEIDRRHRIGLPAEVQNIGHFGVLEAQLADTDINRIATAHSALVVTSPGLKKTFSFRANKTQEAVRVLRSSCRRLD